MLRYLLPLTIFIILAIFLAIHVILAPLELTNPLPHLLYHNCLTILKNYLNKILSVKYRYLMFGHHGVFLAAMSIRY